MLARHTILASLLLGSASAALAQAPVDEGEIIVTAQRRQQNIQEVPISVTAISADTLRARSANNVSDAVQFAPNVSVTAGPNGGDDGGFFIRGVGQLDNSIAVDPGVGVYVDDVYIARLQASSVELLDLARIEVLRGPQGTLFGRNTIGGAISLVTAQPSLEAIGVQARAIYGSRDRIDAAAAINVPLGDTVALRASASTRNQRGWGRNVYTGDTFGDIEDLSGRFKLLFQPNETFSATLSGDYLRGRGSPSHQVLLGFNPAAGITVPRPPFLGGPFFRPGVGPTGVPFPVGVGADRSTDRSLNFASTPAINDVDNGGVSLNITGDLGGVTLKSISAWRRYVETTFNDFDGTGFVLYDNASRLRQQQLSQELQLSGSIGSRGEFLVGAFYFTEDAFNAVDLCVGSNAPRLVDRCIRSRNQIWLDVSSFAGFGQASYDITDAISLVLGARWTTETKRQANTSVLDNRDGIMSVLPPVAIPAPGTARDALPFTQVEQTFTAFTPRVGVNVQLAPRVLAYASYAEGFKSGGFNGRPSSAAIIGYDPETVQSYELGLKTEFFDRLLRINASVFQSDYTNQQLLVFTAISGLFETRNAGDSRIRGFEVEADANISERLALRAAVGHLDAGYRTLSPQVAGITLDTPLPLTPRWTYSLSGEYRQPLGDRLGQLRLRADWQYRSRLSYQLEADPLEVQPGYGLLNLRATWALPDDRWQIAVFGTNVTDTEYLTNAQDTLAGNGTAFGGIGRPAEWGIEVGVKF
ncbi:TonB-dependent receptor [Polymorphobacter multimanifer]|uniref:Iron complex outermembrane receptor protein n=1 Tax=Polymorphobacter multimanifer TaxID=1070431 RepID=A0A841L399_9SPHN|nr:TonB-dependent receptor [Polymorphobacter multimanifer]MBB6226766.1 iron complex outermembrane receptor protein [Polymorphobacter multimanifer]GGI71480.1 TonB-dependent receptor [Polymorphobacter multimanifer]